LSCLCQRDLSTSDARKSRCSFRVSSFSLLALPVPRWRTLLIFEQAQHLPG
jgi:hypothetical protein